MVQTVAEQLSGLIESRETEALLHSQLRQNSAIINNFPEIVYICDPQTYEVLFVNNTMKSLLGKDPVGGLCYHEFQGFDQPCDFCTNSIILETGRPHTWEYFNPVMKRHFKLTDQIIPWHDGRRVRFELATDITDQKQAEEQARQSQGRLMTLINNIPQKVFYKDKASTYILANNAFARDIGIAAADFFGKTDFDIFPRELAEKYRQDDRRILETGRTEELEEQYAHDGKTFYVNTVKTPVVDSDGTVSGVLGLFWDITEKKRTDEELRFRSRLGEIFLTSNDKDLYWQVLQVLLEATGSRQGTFGYIDEKGDLVIPSMTREVWTECSVPDKRDIIFPRERWGGIWGRALVEQKTLCANTPFEVPLGHIPVKNAMTLPILYGGRVVGHILVGNKDGDYTEEDRQRLEMMAGIIAPLMSATVQGQIEEKRRRRAEAAMQEALAELKRSNADLEQFAYVASHDLQEPLRMVSSYTQLLEKRYRDKLDDDARDFIGFAVSGANRMQRLIQDLLTYSRVQTRGRVPEPVDAHAALGSALANLRAAIEESGAIVTNDDLPPVLADETQLVMLFQNLIGNAVKFRGPAPPHIHISAKKKENMQEFSVTDNGIGIEPEYREKIFVIFQRLQHRDRYPGTGIGLALCKRIVQRHKGDIWFESTPDSGTTFFFTLPAISGEVRDG